MRDQTIKRKLDLIERAVSVTLSELGPWEGRRGRHVGPGQYDGLTDWEAVELPMGGAPLETIFLRTQYRPAEAPAGHSLRIRFRLRDVSGMASMDGAPYCGVDRGHDSVAAPDHAAELTIEALSSPSTWAHSAPGYSGGRFESATLEAVHELARVALGDLQYADLTVKAIAAGRRRSLIAAALEDALLAIELTGPREEICEQTVAAAAGLRERLATIGRDPEGGRLFCVGHTHIDTAWLWPIRETIRKCGRTFSTACRLMEKYPDFHFSCSQAQLYAYTKDHYPPLYEQIKHWVKAGRWHATGAMWVEADCNLPSGESLVRQLLQGIGFFEREFGVRPRSCWLPDTFGFSASLPQILSRAGVPYFFTYKVHWQSSEAFPEQLFWWEGIDGSRVLGHTPLLVGAYNGVPTPDQLDFAWENFAQKDQHPELMFPYGYGDGGGGPTEEMVEQFRRATDYPGLPQCRTGGEEQYFAEAEAAGAVTDVWADELYLRTHRGTYTTHAPAKRENRRCEEALRDAEVLATAAAWAGTTVDLGALQGCWRRVLTNQFHDILPGSSVATVYEDAARDYADALATAAEAIGAATGALTQEADAAAICVVNTSSWRRGDPVRVVVARAALPAGPVTVTDADGAELPAQVADVSDTEAEVVFCPGAVAGMAASNFRLTTGAAEIDNPFVVDDRRIEGPHSVVEFAEDGSIRRLLDKDNGREVAADGGLLNEWQFFQDGPQREDAWNYDTTYTKRRYPAEGPAEFEVIERGPVRAIVRITRRFRESSFVQDVVVHRDLARIDFVTEADWRQRQVLLKAAFRPAVRSRRATFEIPYGAIERPTHRNTAWDQAKFEVCALRWADLSEPGYGVSLLNDCKYGHDILDDCLRLTLLRGTSWPDDQADLGRHRFTYSLMPHAGDWVAAQTVRRAAELNVPLRALPGRSAASTVPWLSVEGAGAIAETLKPAEDGDGWIVRVYEPHGARGKVTLTPARRLASVVETNLVEDDEGDIPLQDGGFTASLSPFQIRTFRLRVQ